MLSQVRRLFPPVAVYYGSVDHDCYLEVSETCHPLWRPPVGLTSVLLVVSGLRRTAENAPVFTTTRPATW